jgi:tetratricopeptide (TPR) repeat protein
MQCFEQRRYDEALRVTTAQLCRDAEPDWNLLYLAGQSAKFLGRLAEARNYLERAVGAGGDVAEVYLALGTVLQALRELPAACKALEHALQKKPGYELAHNSLGLTYRMMGRLNDALTEYDQALSWYARRVAESLPNERLGPVLAHRDTTTGEAWIAKAVDAMTYLGAKLGACRVSWPSGKQAEEETRSRQHGGLLYLWQTSVDGKRVMHFLPNFFNSFRAALKDDLAYAILLNNIGGVLAELGRTGEARKCYREAMDFTPDGVDYRDPRDGLAELESE